MSNKPRRRTPAQRPAGRPSNPSPGSGGRSNTTTLIIIAAAVALVAVLAVVIGVIVGGGDDDDDGDEAADVSVPVSEIVADCSADDIGEAIEPATPDAFPADDIFKPVAIAGTPLDPFSREIQNGTEPDTALCQQAPVLSGFDYTGEPVTIDPAADGPTLVVFLAHWCPHCNAEVPVLNEWRDSGDVPDGLNVVGVSTAVREGEANYPPDEWITEMDWTWPVLADGDISVDDGADGEFHTALRAYGATTFPTLAFVDGDGLLRWRVSGELPIPVIQQLVDAAMPET